MMKAQLKYSPDLRDCVLEDRLVPVLPNPGLGPEIVLTTYGYVLSPAFPGALIPASFVMTGPAGISGTQPGNSNGGAAGTIVVGSGANDAVATIIALVTRNTVVNDALRAAPLIAPELDDRSDVLVLAQVDRGGLAVTGPRGVSTEAPGPRSGQDPDETTVEPLPIRLHSRPHHLASDASGYPGRSHRDFK